MFLLTSNDTIQYHIEPIGPTYYTIYGYYIATKDKQQ